MPEIKTIPKTSPKCRMTANFRSKWYPTKIRFSEEDLMKELCLDNVSYTRHVIEGIFYDHVYIKVCGLELVHYVKNHSSVDFDLHHKCVLCELRLANINFILPDHRHHVSTYQILTIDYGMTDNMTNPSDPAFNPLYASIRKRMVEGIMRFRKHLPLTLAICELHGVSRPLGPREWHLIKHSIKCPRYAVRTIRNLYKIADAKTETDNAVS